MKISNLLTILFLIGLIYFFYNAETNAINSSLNKLKCPIGIMLYTPIIKINGYDVLIPSIDDLLVTFFIFVFILFILRSLGTTISWKRKISMFVLIWICLKFIAFYLIYTTDGCQTLLDIEEEITKGLDFVQIILLPLFIILIVLKILEK